MNYTRRTWLTTAGALSFGTLLTRCGGGSESPYLGPCAGSRRSPRPPPELSAKRQRRPMVVWWSWAAGWPALAAAKYLKLWGGTGVQVTLIERNPSYTSNILSNLVLTGQRTLASLVYSYTAVKQNYGVDVRQGDVVGIDPVLRRVTLADRSSLPYDRLIVAPGVVFDILPGLETAAAQAAWCMRGRRVPRRPRCGTSSSQCRGAAPS